MSKEEIYQFLLDNNVHDYSLLNEIYAIRDKRHETVDYTICVYGYISVDTLNRNLELQKENKELKEKLELKSGLNIAVALEKSIKERDQQKELLDKIYKILNETKLQDFAGGKYFSVKEFEFVEDIQNLIKEYEDK